MFDKQISNLEKNSSESASPCISSLIDYVKGLRAVLQVLLAQIPTVKGSEVRQSYITFDDAFSPILPTRKEKLRFL